MDELVVEDAGMEDVRDRLRVRPGHVRTIKMANLDPRWMFFCQFSRCTQII